MNQPQPVLRVPLGRDLLGFTRLLRRLEIRHRVVEEGDSQVLWVLDSARAEEARSLYERYPDGDPQGQVPPTQRRRGLGLLAQLKASPFSAAVLLVTLLVGLATELGDNPSVIQYLTLQPFRLVDADHLAFLDLGVSLAQGEWWRLVTPIFLHFGILHLAMNALWYWELGRRVEFRQGGLMLLLLTLVFAVGSNLAQYAWSGPALFGGLSGVLYGLLGHCWLFQWLAPNPAYRMPRGVVAMMLIWLVICLTGVFGVLGFGAIANGAHVGGLVLGCLSGLLGGGLARLRPR
ncbi:rhomboid family intramembrane serine protease [Pseudomonas oryzihabitans]|uniref:rhomboid family intramembrane serine protease n=1 Tax=Pseudomonas oryzihabitans TaxID=47885 RepID=UPI00111EAC75|nr:rhomboid family intramembrane serine protease [Pseudomonas psychrotolerans]QDD88744.1 rhomboid family intramembrane serine protease [Pseudomonas psychrotolerans]